MSALCDSTGRRAHRRATSAASTYVRRESIRRVVSLGFAVDPRSFKLALTNFLTVLLSYDSQNRDTE